MTTMVDRFSAAFRSTHLGASQWPAAVGADPYTDPLLLWERFVGRASWDDDREEAGDARSLGRALERGIIDEACRMIGVTWRPSATVADPRASYRVCTPDGLTPGGALIEAKSVRLASPSTEYAETWGADGTADVPRRVLVQVMGSLSIVRASIEANTDHPDELEAAGLPSELPSGAHVFALIGGRGLCTYWVPWDPVLAATLTAQVDEFWWHVQSGVPPKAMSFDALLDFLARKHPQHARGSWVEANADDAAAMYSYAMARAARDEAEHAMAQAEAWLCARIGDNEGIELRNDGRVVGRATWRSKRGRVDWRRLAETLHHNALQAMPPRWQALAPTIDAIAERYRGDRQRPFGVKIYDDSMPRPRRKGDDDDSDDEA